MIKLSFVNYMNLYVVFLIIIIILIMYSIYTNNTEITYLKPLKWFVMGDIGVYNKEFYQLVQNRGYDYNQFAIILGDNFYPFGIDDKTRYQWKNIKHLNYIFNKPMYAILGNHDYHRTPQTQILFKNYNWNMPNYYYYKQYPKHNLGIWFIDTQILTLDGPDLNKELIESKVGKNKHSEHLRWLERTLSESSDLIKIVCGHYPLFSNGNYRENLKLIKILYPLFKKYNVKVYFAGHDHTFQHLIRNYNNYKVHQFIIGSSSELRTHNVDNNSNDILISEMAVATCELNDMKLNVKAMGLKNNLLYETIIDFTTE